MQPHIDRYTDHRLDRFDPLPRILVHDDFNHGLNGWIGLIGNYEDSLDKMLPVFKPMTQPMLSTAVGWDSGSHGGLSGAFSMKVATRPIKGTMNLALKRLSFRHLGEIQLEAYLAVKPEASDATLSIEDVRSFGMFMDLQSNRYRGLPHVRFLNCLDGTLRQTWQFKQKVPPDTIVSSSSRTRSLQHLYPEGWEDVPDGYQEICYNELPTKMNWQYFKAGIDLAEMRFTSLQFNDRKFDPAGLGVMRLDPWANLECMLNIGFFVETDTDKRAFLYVDSVLLSGDF
ncbi:MULTISPECIES: DUF6772 family protein [unclassified Chelatococcus]|jgi:hypothetical protein|uniref:DUF6772 family protein n=1 Tax=unclassified Chelatococcus TaxID=2638111 RepID=UPI001BCE9403|nr:MULTISPECIES: DUF6772 family protein [unclassified Chelatococcus]CAH1657678.1 conserved hypothetical protein [Hyphomicrobiales bacterium]MBS7742277.1 hypothetical protein [Chelatococcus sp. HY11]MBX3542605.1 hypothetical protein [Chelatococcus sp.]MCO5075178.1 hypothetical protein [Chelatococcus sp.]CAH1689269.1 conserved hypothetical protein [Hyphomicrobiales bacterium]